jgi:hypothetical protein
MLRDVWGLSVGDLHSEDAKGPHVDLVVVGVLTLDELGCHPADGADLRLAATGLAGEHFGVSEIGQLDRAVGFNKDVVRLDVAMDDVLLMKLE